ncbi:MULTISPECIES: hypothetical protein [unclassified Chelatococcus]|uniref:hypothetical protein n=1 Tax=unclassified Chelatococcus TaxID=2638111 RepID=UPI001BCB860E|nr:MULTISPECIES: hypothetical protein [unclassified Chelatococcus]MBS7741468.1 hypothetical protein [Chelatococcus sp. HY11]MBX3544512.1 hypothetical protein [Chelatococcus sp.]MCO5078964.1 hypothetical protein [Chelatococcus sp.]
MSRGPGRIEQAIAKTFEDHQEETFDVEELARIVYPGINRIEKKHRVAVLRAARKVAWRMNWSYWYQEVPSAPAVFGNLLNVRSYGLAMVRSQYRWRPTTLDQHRARVDDPKSHDSRWAWIQPGGSWWLHVEINKAKANGDDDRAADLKRQLNRSLVPQFIRAGLRPPPEIMENAK